MLKKIIIYAAVFSIFTFNIFAQTETEQISLDLKGMDIRDVLKILSQKSSLNIVADKDVKVKVDIYLKDVNVLDALDIIVSTNGLAYEKEDGLIRVMTDRDYERLHGKKFEDRTKIEIVKLEHATASYISNAIKQIKSKIGNIIPDDRSNTIVLIDTPVNIQKMKDAIAEIDVPLVTEVFDLDYAEAEAMKGKLTEIVTKGQGNVRFDERTNKVVVEDTPKKIEEIRKIIEAFDEKNLEVLIEANIIQVTLSDKYSFGIDWTAVASLPEVSVAMATDLSTGLTNVTPTPLTIARKSNTDENVVMSLLKTFGETDVLSKPTITVLNNEEAKILVGSKEVYVTSEVTTTSGGTYHTTDHVQFVDVGVTLTVVPTINKAGYVTMKIKPEVSSTTETVTLENPDGSTRTQIPVVTASEAETTVVVKDDTTIIIGGLMKDTIVDHREKVPFFGDIPLLGKLFTSTGKSKEKTELVIFLTPHIVEGDETAGDVESYLDYWDEKRIDLTHTSGADSYKYEEREDTAEEVESWGPTAFIKKTPYEDYYMVIRKKIDSIARSQQDTLDLAGEVELQFTLDRNGSIIRGPIVLNKPDLTLVRNAVDCVRLASPFPQFPETMRKEEAAFYVVVRYE